MAFCELHYFSAALQKQTAANVLLPQNCGAGPFPVYYLLHGLGDDHAAWMRRTSIERYADGLSLIVVMPDGGRGFYTDAAEGFAHESAIMCDLVPFIDAAFPTRATREGRCIGGLSMGGYGAIKLALKYPRHFCSATSHSGALTKAHIFRSGETEELRRIFGTEQSGGANDLFALAEKIDRKLLPAMRIDCGTADYLLDRSRDFHAHLEQLGIAHEYEEFPGAHDWAYWDARAPEAIAFHCRALGIARS